MQTFMDGRGLGALVQAGRDVASRLAMGQECLILAVGLVHVSMQILLHRMHLSCACAHVDARRWHEYDGFFIIPKEKPCPSPFESTAQVRPK